MDWANEAFDEMGCIGGEAMRGISLGMEIHVDDALTYQQRVEAIMIYGEILEGADSHLYPYSRHYAYPPHR